MRRPLALTLLISALALAGCGSDRSPSGQGALTDQGTRFEVAPGEEFVISLESNPSTGFAWQLETTPSPEVVSPVEDTFVATDSDLTGVPGRQELTFEGVGAGSASISLWYIRAFDDPPEPAERTQFEVLVVGAAASETDQDPDDELPAPAAPDDENAIDVIDLMRDRPSGDVVVRGILFDDGAGLVLCEALAESYPPQCVGDRFALSGDEPTGVEFSVEAGVRWTDRPVVLRGRLSDGGFEVRAD